MKRYIIYSILLMTVIILAGCKRRPLDFVASTGATITVITHWDSTGLHPNGMTISFYPAGGGSPYTVMSNGDTTEFNLPAGDYNLLVFNETVSDFTSLHFANVSDFHKICAYTEGRTKKYYDDIRDTPERLASFAKSVSITSDMVRYSFHQQHGTPLPEEIELSEDDMIIHAWPKVVTCIINTRLWADKLSKVASAGGYLCHFASGVYLASGKVLPDDAIFKINFGERTFVSGDEGYFYNSTVAFGFYNDVFPPVSGYSFDFLAVLSDNSGFRETMDIDDNISYHYGAFGELNINIDISPGVEIPDVEEQQTWNIGVNEWENEEVPIIL